MSTHEGVGEFGVVSEAFVCELLMELARSSRFGS